MMRLAPVFAAIVLGALVSQQAPKSLRVGTIPASRLVALSEVIVVGEVTSVELSGATSLHIARVKVSQVWRGDVQDEVSFVSTPSWTCDISSAHVGEYVLLFLARKEICKPLSIAHSGRGRLPLMQFAGDTFAIPPSTGVRWPDGLVYRVESNVALSGQVIRLSDLDQYVASELSRLAKQEEDGR